MTPFFLLFNWSQRVHRSAKELHFVWDDFYLLCNTSYNNNYIRGKRWTLCWEVPLHPTPPSFELFIRKYTGTTWGRWRKEELHSEDFLSDVAHPVVSDWNKNSVVLLFVDCFSFYSHCLLTEDVAEIIGLWVLEMNWGWVRESRLEPWE